MKGGKVLSSKMERFKAINEETGEVQELIKLGPDYMLVHKNSAQSYREKMRLEELRQNGRGRSWVACYHEPIRETSKTMTLFECGTVLKLLLYISFKDNGVLTLHNQPMKLKDIQLIIKKGETQTRTILTSLEEKNILRKEKQGRNNVYIMNPDFHSMGEILESVSFTKLFQSKTKELLEDINLNQAGVLYKILPYFHYTKCLLCLNPDEQDEAQIHFLSQEELASHIEIDVDTVSKHMKALQHKFVIAETRSGKVVNYYVHPDLMFRLPSHMNEHKDVIKARGIFEDLMLRKANEKKRLH